MRTYLYAAMLLTMYIVVTAADIRWLWGFNFGRFYSSGLFYTTVILIALTLIPKLGVLIDTGIHRSAHVLSTNRKAMFLATGSILALFALLSWEFPAATNFLGDGTLRLNLIRNGDFLLITEPGDFLIHALINKYLAQPFSQPVQFSYQLTATFSGIVFLAGCWRLLRYLRCHSSVTCFLLLITSGLSVQFFGYVESYAILAALLPYIVTTGLKVIDRASSGYLLFSLYLIAGFIHPVGLLILSGFLAFVLLSRFNRYSSNAVQCNKILLMLIPAALVAVYILRYFGIDMFVRNILPLSSGGGGGQALLTMSHLSNVINWLLLSALPIGFLCLSMKAKSWSNWFDSPRKCAAVWLIIPSLLFILFFTPQLGGGRDWDIFSLPALLILIGFLIGYNQGTSEESTRTIPAAAIPIILLALFNTVAFIGVNSSVLLSTDRCTELVEMATFRNRTREYMMLYNFSKENDKLYDQRVGFAEKVLNQPPYTKNDSLYIIGELASLSMERGDQREARKYIDLGLKCDSADLNTHLAELAYYSRFGTSADIRTVAERMEGLLHGNPLGLMNAGVVYLQQGDVQKGGGTLERAYQLEPDNTLIIMNYATYLLQSREYKRAAELFAIVTDAEPENFLGWYYEAMANFESGQEQRAHECLEAAKKQIKTKQQRQMVVELEKEMGKR